jgi:hypothetical protein
MIIVFWRESLIYMSHFLFVKTYMLTCILQGFTKNKSQNSFYVKKTYQELNFMMQN